MHSGFGGVFFRWMLFFPRSLGSKKLLRTHEPDHISRFKMLRPKSES
jgi:hypothetical protein